MSSQGTIKDDVKNVLGANGLDYRRGPVSISEKNDTDSSKRYCVP